MLLVQDRAWIQKHLVSLDRSFAVVAALIARFSPLARAIRPDVAISECAKVFLREFDASGGGKLLEFTNLQTGLLLLTMDGPTNTEIRYGDPRFYEDDIRQLVEADLLRITRNSDGNMRRARRVVRLNADQ